MGRPIWPVAVALLAAAHLSQEPAALSSHRPALRMAAKKRAGASSLSGAWSGLYVYPWKQRGIPLRVPFNALIEDDAGALSGEIDEPNTFIAGAPPTLRFSLVGARRGVDVSFVKTLLAPVDIDAIHYFGTASADFDRIEGRWVIASDFSGAFTMERSGVAAETSAERSASV